MIFSPFLISSFFLNVFVHLFVCFSPVDALWRKTSLNSSTRIPQWYYAQLLIKLIHVTGDLFVCV